MDIKNIEKAVKKILIRRLKMRGLIFSVKSDDSIIASGMLDSLSAVELVAELERSFNIKILSEEMTESNFDSVLKIADLVSAKLKGDR